MMNHRYFFIVLISLFATYAKAGFIIYPQPLYWECSMTPDPYTGAMQFVRGDGQTKIVIYPDVEEPKWVKEGSVKLILEYSGKNNGWYVYDTQYPAKKVWTKDEYVMIVSYMYGRPTYMARYNPNKGVISGSQADINRYDYPNSSGSSYSGSKNRSSSKSKSTCSTCNGTRVNPQQSAGGSHYTWVAHYNKDGNRCPYCNKYNEHFHNKCPSCNVPKY